MAETFLFLLTQLGPHPKPLPKGEGVTYKILAYWSHSDRTNPRISCELVKLMIQSAANDSMSQMPETDQ